MDAKPDLPLLETLSLKLYTPQSQSPLSRERLLIKQLTWQVLPGEWWAVLGPNGVGKSLLLATLVGARAPDAGQVLLAGAEIARWTPKARARLLAWLTQHAGSLKLPGMSVLQSTLLGLLPHLGRWRWEDEAAYRAAERILAELELDQLADQDMASLSGGEQQRAAIARVLLQRPQLYLLDEPLNHLDLRHQKRVLDLLHARCREGAAIISVLHDPNWAVRYASHLLLLFGNGRTLTLPAAALTAELLSELYGLALCAARSDGAPPWVPRDSDAPLAAPYRAAPPPQQGVASGAAAAQAE